jgi:tryptophan synthase beta chain
MFYPFVGHQDVALVGVEAGGRSDQPGDHAAPLTYGQPGVLHGSYSYVMQDNDGQTCDVHSMSAGLDYPGVGPEHAWFRDSGRAAYPSVTDEEALDAFLYLTRTEGIIPALESSHAIAQLRKLAPTLPKDAIVVVNLSGRGDKDVPTVRAILAERAAAAAR